ncbi:MAG: hypothetical protein WBW85_22945 [Terriglobales bacterium]
MRQDSENDYVIVEVLWNMIHGGTQREVGMVRGREPSNGHTRVDFSTELQPCGGPSEAEGKPATSAGH